MHNAKTENTYGAGVALKEVTRKATQKLTTAVRSLKNKKKGTVALPVLPSALLRCAGAHIREQSTLQNEAEVKGRKEGCFGCDLEVGYPRRIGTSTGK